MRLKVLVRVLRPIVMQGGREHDETRGDPVRNAESAPFNHPVKASDA